MEEKKKFCQDKKILEPQTIFFLFAKKTGLNVNFQNKIKRSFSLVHKLCWAIYSCSTTQGRRNEFYLDSPPENRTNEIQVYLTQNHNDLKNWG